MSFKLIDTELLCYPDWDGVASGFARVGATVEDFVETLSGFVCDKPRSAGEGYQQHIAKELEDYLRTHFAEAGLSVERNPAYAPPLGEKGDLAIVAADGVDRVFVEIEFRPNVEKDLVKFQMGFNVGRLAAGVLVMATHRESINAAYGTMPEFEKFSRVVQVLRPNYPLLIVGIDGEHA